ncbi:MAG: radical SAM protein [Ignavibacteriota bacterium]|mgnify:FL=1|nr:radical SAM protein [Ignavibacteriota bacterium]MCO6446039.1 radical SAM protein [Ignavibacterium album]MCZ2267481.1 radical SAM protein [Ignavibacteriales bacterium]HOJ07441.1 radical SAM protein [Ignavibacteriaceae bacterium]MEB2355000.1 radical SAM protein [Ignavibacteriales bacterium]
MGKPYFPIESLYRMPWTMPDNGITWLEPTSQCNLNCYGCYRKNIKDSHKSIEQIKHELDFFQSQRKSDCISIAGGDPLVYPNIIELVKEIKSRGLKPIINTNGIALTKQLLHELKKAGVFGFTFHIDSKQGRGREEKWRNKNEVELNELRLYYAEMLAAEGGIACSFNSTIYSDTLQYVPELVDWAQKHIDIVDTMVFILFRYITPNTPFDFYIGDSKIVWTDIHYHSEYEEIVDLKSPMIVEKIREKFPDFTPSAFLNGTHKADDYKWLLSERIGNRDKIFGYTGKKFMELVMISYHFMFDKYLSYASPKTLRMGRSTMFLLSVFDKGVRKALKNYLKYLVVNPLRFFKRAHLQSILIIQPPDLMPNGDQSMCDGCPDITYWKDKDGKEKLVWSCRLEEPMKYGDFLRMVPKREKGTEKEKENVLHYNYNNLAD